ncbi:MAG: DM13 domain-containing protein, partial [Phycisphaerales bacterium JB043]
APDLKIALSPRRQKDITRKNALEGALVIGQLTRSSGRQEFRIPDDTDVSAFSTLVIHCEQYSKLWGTSIIREGRVIASAPSWIKKTKRTRGGYEIVTREDGLFLRFGDDFRTPKAPEPLRVLLSTQSAKEATNKSAERDATLVATTSQYSGGQEFRLPEDIDLSKYRSVLLNCLKYTKLWSAAPLE